MATTEQILAALQEFLKPEPRIRRLQDYIMLNILPRIVCTDGFSVSVQASAMAYATPRDNNGPWTAVELGFPNRPDAALSEYAEDSTDLTGTVYSYVPIEVVAELLARHGVEPRQLALPAPTHHLHN